MAQWTVRQGFALGKTVTAKDGNGVPVTGYTGSEPLAGVVWAGDDRTPLVTLANGAGVSWVTPPAIFRVALSTADTASLLPGVYQVEAYPADKSADFLHVSLEILPAAGLAPPLFSYITYGQMLAYAPQVGRLQDATADEAQFAEQRNIASKDFDRLVLDRYAPQPGRSRRYLDATGTVPGPYLVFAPGPGGAGAPTRATIAGYLGTSAVIANQDLVECVAHLALATIYLGQPGKDSVFRETGMSEKALAQQQFKRVLVEIDTNADGVAEIRIDQDITFLT